MRGKNGRKSPFPQYDKRISTNDSIFNQPPHNKQVHFRVILPTRAFYKRNKKGQHNSNEVMKDSAAHHFTYKRLTGVGKAVKILSFSRIDFKQQRNMTNSTLYDPGIGSCLNVT